MHRNKSHVIHSLRPCRNSPLSKIKLNSNSNFWDNTGCFIMFTMTTNIYNEKTKVPTLIELITATGKLKKFFLTIRMFNVSTTGDKAHINTIFKFSPHTRQQWSKPKDTDHCSNEEYRCTHVDTCVARTWISYRCVPCHPWCTHQTPLVVKNNFFGFPVAVKNSIKVGPLTVE
jgi:hypothetical protein